MAAVMGELGYIEMRGYNDFNKYKYAKAADIAAACAKAMAKHGIAFSATEESVEWPDPRTSAKGGTLYLCRARVKFTFFDTESDEKIEVVRTGQATDSGDKDIFKAFTGALKYALVQTFLIATGDDPEDDSDEKKTGGTAEPKGKVELKPDPKPEPKVPATASEINEILELCEQTQSDLARMLKFYGHDYDVQKTAMDNCIGVLTRNNYLHAKEVLSKKLNGAP